MKALGRSAWAALGLPAAYFIAGRLGLLLAIPPGYATAVWPPTGIALTAILVLGNRAWPGIWLGSFLVNLLITPKAADPRALLVAAVIAVGAALQALAGAALIRRYVGFPTPLDGGRDVGRFLMLGGPVSCLINATWSVTTLWIAGVIPGSNAMFSWWTWWVGDAIGVLITTPLLLVWTGAPAAIWRRRKLTMAAPLTVLFTIFVGVFFIASASEQRRVNLEFDQRASRASAAIEKSLGDTVEMLQGIASLRSIAGPVSRDEFHHLVYRWRSRGGRFHAIAWIPRVTDRAALEDAARQEGFREFEITERRPDGQIVRAPERPEYLPVLYIEPLAGNEAALGYDLASEPTRFEALTLARETGEPVASRQVALIQDTSPRPGFLVFAPVYERSLAGGSRAQERRKALLGFVSGVFRVDEVIDGCLKDTDAGGLGVRLEDIGDSRPERLIYGDPAAGDATGLVWSTTFKLAGRRFSLRLAAEPAYVAERLSLQAWTVLAAGLLFTGLLGAFLLVITGTTSKVESLVAERTAALEREVEEHRRTAAELAAAKDAAEAASQSKSAFLMSTSHEIRTPLNAILGYTELLQEEAADLGRQSIIPDVERIHTAGMHLLSLINRVLDLSKVEAGRMEVFVERVEIRSLIEEICGTVRPLVARGNNRLELDLPDGLGTMRSDPVKIRQVLLNLLSNAAKFTAAGTISVAASRVREEGTDWMHIRVSDTGIGIAAEQRASLFTAFSQANSEIARNYGGTGLGLALSKHYCELLQGAIDVESEPGRGTTFMVRLPAEIDDPLDQASPQTGNP